jgi:adenylate kinase
VLQKKLGLTPIESGNIFRQNVKNQTSLGKRADAFLQRGDLVPDEITIPMVLDCLSEVRLQTGWLLDGFPRNVEQAMKLWENLATRGLKVDYIIEIELDRESAKKRIMGRRICLSDPTHPNNLYMDGFKPLIQNNRELCQVCKGNLHAREDDLNESSIDKRHKIYYDERDGTKAAVNWLKNNAQQCGTKMLTIDGRPRVADVSRKLLNKLDCTRNTDSSISNHPI